MKTFPIVSFLAMAITITSAVVQLDPNGRVLESPQQPYLQQQPYPEQQQPLPQQPFPQQPQQPISQQQTLPQQQPLYQQQPHQQPLTQEQQSFPQQPQPPFPQQQQYPQQQPFPQQSLPQQQQPMPQQSQQPLPQQQFPQQPQQARMQQQPSPQKPFPEQQQQPLFQPFPEQELNACTEFILQQCRPRSSSELSSRALQIQTVILSQFGLRRSGCKLMQQQCCEQMSQISEQDRCTAIHSITHAIIVQQEQQKQLQQQVGQDFSEPQQQESGQGTLVQPQQQLGQGFIEPQQIAQFQSIMSLVLQTVPKMCNVHVMPYCSTMTAPFVSIVVGSGQ